MTVDLLRQRKSQSHEHDGPDNGMETNDLLTYEVNISGPVFFELAVIIRTIAKSGDIVGKSVYPNVYNVLFIKGNGDTPIERGS